MRLSNEGSSHSKEDPLSSLAHCCFLTPVKALSRSLTKKLVSDVFVRLNLHNRTGQHLIICIYI